MEIQICPIKRLYRILAEGEADNCGAIISASSEIQKEKLRGIPFVFRQYEDLDWECPGRSISREDGKAMADYVKASTDMDTLYCCCDAGESRSPAVAAAVMRYLGMDDMAIWRDPHYHPNMLVYEKLMDAFGLPVTDEEKDYRLYTNQKAFRDALRSKNPQTAQKQEKKKVLSQNGLKES